MAIAGHATTTANLGANVLAAEYLQSTFQNELFNNFVAYPLAEKAALPKGMGTTVTYNKIVKWTTALTANTEGDTGFPITLTSATVQATLLEYIAYGEYSELLDLSAVTGTSERIAKNIGYVMATTVDTLIHTSALADATNTNDEGVAMTAEGLRKAAQELATLNVPHHSGTPGGAYYCSILSPEQFYDMIGEGAPTWIQAMRAELTGALRTPWADQPSTSAVYDVMVKKSSNVVVSGGNDVGYVFGDGAFFCASLGPDIAPESEGYRPRLIVTGPGEHVDQPGRNKGTAAGKMYYASEKLDINCIVKVLSDQS